MQFKKAFFYPFLFLYHSVFTVIAYDYFMKKGGDANLYWFNSPYVEGKTWMDFFNYGTDLILFINYPFAKLIGLPFWFGFALYSCIGFLGILQFCRLAKLWIGDDVILWGINILPFVLLMPNLHFWTAILGKEPLVFLFIATIMLECFKKKYFSFPSLISLILLLLIRPHVALMVVFSLGMIVFLFENWNWKKKIGIAMVGVGLLVCSFFMFLKLSNIKRFDWAKIQDFNDYSLLSLKDSNSYIPMIEYSYPEKIVAFYFRPLFFDIHNVYGFFVSLENFLLILFHLIGIGYLIKYYRQFKPDILWKGIMVYYLVAGLLFVQRYSDLGLLIRTKVMIQPFAILAIVWLLKQVKPEIIKKL